MLGEENKKVKFILASSSPRRRDVFRLLKLDFVVLNAKGVQERLQKDPIVTVKKNSLKKVKAVLNYVTLYEDYADTIICGFDTIVYFRNKYYPKPKTVEQATSFIRELSANTHTVISGVALMSLATEKEVIGWEKTEVKFRKLNEKQIKNYLDTENIFDKAAGYNIGGAGAFMVEKINGCFFNVTGMPVYRFTKLLEELDYKFQFNKEQ